MQTCLSIVATLSNIGNTDKTDSTKYLSATDICALLQTLTRIFAVKVDMYWLWGGAVDMESWQHLLHRLTSSIRKYREYKADNILKEHGRVINDVKGYRHWVHRLQKGLEEMRHGTLTWVRQAFNFSKSVKVQYFTVWRMVMVVMVVMMAMVVAMMTLGISPADKNFSPEATAPQKKPNCLTMVLHHHHPNHQCRHHWYFNRYPECHYMNK